MCKTHIFCISNVTIIFPSRFISGAKMCSWFLQQNMAAYAMSSHFRASLIGERSIFVVSLSCGCFVGCAEVPTHLEAAAVPQAPTPLGYVPLFT